MVSDTPPNPSSDPSQVVPGCYVRPPALQITPQMSDSADTHAGGDSLPAGTRPIDVVI